MEKIILMRTITYLPVFLLVLAVIHFLMAMLSMVGGDILQVIIKPTWLRPIRSMEIQVLFPTVLHCLSYTFANLKKQQTLLPRLQPSRLQPSRQRLVRQASHSLAAAKVLISAQRHLMNFTYDVESFSSENNKFGCFNFQPGKF